MNALKSFHQSESGLVGWGALIKLDDPQFKPY